MIGDTHVPEKTIVRNNTFAKLDDSWFMLVMQVALHEPFADLDDLTKREMLTWNSIEAPGRLNHLVVSSDKNNGQVD